jgi:DNA adenine methylase
MKQRSFLKWAGNKYNCLEHLLPTFPKAKRLIEPFTGSATIFLNTNFENNILAEENIDLVNLFESIKKGREDFVKYCNSFFTDQNNQKDNYYLLRDKFNLTSDIIERSALFLYLNKHGYNGLCRYNSSGIFNVPFGRYDKPYFPYKELIKFIKKSDSAIFVHKDFAETFKLAEPGDLIYCDPPYSPIEQESNFSAYTKKKFDSDNHIKLANLAKEASAKGIKVIISNHDTEFTRLNYSEANIKTYMVRRNISREPNSRLQVKELIAIF